MRQEILTYCGQRVLRRNFLNNLIRVAGGLAFAGFGGYASLYPTKARASGNREVFLIEGYGSTAGFSIDELVRKVFAVAGGLSVFISRGDTVVLKPNISWARSPDLGATVNPELLKSLIGLCYEAGAKKVRIADNTINDARRYFAITGAGVAAESSNGDLVMPRSSLMKEMKIGGRRLDIWPVFTPVVEADKLINIAVAKHHSLTGLTLGMKNWIGAVGGRRHALHQDIHQTIVDLAGFFKPTLTLIDATRIMIRNGPSGGSPSDVVEKNRIILSNDPVAADARAAVLFGQHPQDIGYIKLAVEQGIGNFDILKEGIKKVIV